MSISVKSASILIAGTKSEEFDIRLEGGLYHLDNFTLTQRLLSPNVLAFTMHKDPEEDISEALFAICGFVIGKEIEVNLQTEIISSASGEDKAGEISFRGVIVSASGNREQSEYFISVEAQSWEVLLDDNPNCKSYEEHSLNDIIRDVLDDYSDYVEANVHARFAELIPYCVQYNETDYQFIQRLARRYGEWLYNDGKHFVFGQLPHGRSVKLTYPSQDVPAYSAELKMRHVAFSHIASSYHAYDAEMKDGTEEMQREYNTLSEQVFQASVERFVKPTVQHLHSGGFADTDSRETILSVSTKTQARGEKAGMLTYTGTTYCSNLSIGGTLVIEDNFISNGVTNEKSAVVQDEILIVELTHFFTKNKEYRNYFTGIPAACDYPPYEDADVYPVASSCRARVTANEDPLDLGRVRVQFDWQAQQEPDMMTPWLRMAQPYGGGGKGFSFIPEIDEEVMVGFEGGNAERPYVEGTLYNGVGAPDGSWLLNHNRKNQVKAIRTRNGHTVEIHDEGENGYIRIYDNGKENYVLTFSTDQKLIKLESSGNIELYAKNDIVLHAGRNIDASAGHDENVQVGNDRAASVGRNDTCGVGANQFVRVAANKDERVVNKLQITAESIRVEAEDKLLLYSTDHEQKAASTMALNAAQRIDIKASETKIN